MFPDFSTKLAVLQWVVFEYLLKKAVEGLEPAPGFNLAERKLSFAKRVAELFDRYAVHRPEMILDWNAGKDTDGATPLSDNQMWQSILWRELQSIIEASDGKSESKLCEPYIFAKFFSGFKIIKLLQIEEVRQKVKKSAKHIKFLYRTAIVSIWFCGVGIVGAAASHGVPTPLHGLALWLDLATEMVSKAPELFLVSIPIVVVIGGFAMLQYGWSVRGRR